MHANPSRLWLPLLLSTALAISDVGDPLRVLIISTSQRSHMLAIRGLAEELASAPDIEVEWAAHSEDKGFIMAGGAEGQWEFVDAGTEPKPASYYDYTRTIFQLFELAADYSLSLAVGLQRHVLERPPHVIIYDGLFEASAYYLSEKAGGVLTVRLLPFHSGLDCLGCEPDSHPMLASGFSGPVISLPNRLQNFVMLRVARYVLGSIRWFKYDQPVWAQLDVIPPASELQIHGS